MKFQNILVARATGRTDPDENKFQEIREKIILQKEFDDYIPDFITSGAQRVTNTPFFRLGMSEPSPLRISL